MSKKFLIGLLIVLATVVISAFVWQINEKTAFEGTAGFSFQQWFTGADPAASIAVQCPAGCFDCHNQICCNSGWEACKGIRNPLPPWNLIAFCSAKEISCAERGGRFCSGPTRSDCCFGDRVCAHHRIYGRWGAVCLPPPSDCGVPGARQCDTTQAGQPICCKPPNNNCSTGNHTIGGLHVCIAGPDPGNNPAPEPQCGNGYESCLGGGDFRWQSVCCKTPETFCAQQPSGQAFCKKFIEQELPPQD